jgi:hypothetical protein
VTPEQFLARHQPALATMLEEYLAEGLSHSTASERAWSILESWTAAGVNAKLPYVPGERVFWATVWALQHLADEEHWSDGITQRDLSSYLQLLNSGRDLPEGESARRPTDS